MRYLSVCSGIEAASVAWETLGWSPVAFSEIEPFPSCVLATRFPGVPNLGDMTKFREWDIERGAVDLIVGGTPCQAFSVAGLRKGLEDPRGNLSLVYVAMVDHYRPEWILWENVPGVLSSNGGRDFGAFIGALAHIGYGFSWRVLDAQYFGVPQRRRRVFLVGHSSGDSRRATQVLFEPESLRGNPPQGKRQGEETTSDTATGSRIRLWKTVGTLCADTHPGAYAGQDAYTGRLIPVESISMYQHHPQDTRIKEEPDTAQTVTARWGTGGGNTPLVSHAYAVRTANTTANGIGVSEELAYTLDQAQGQAVSHAFKIRGGCEGGGKGYLGQDEMAYTISTNQDQYLMQSMAVRRLTPVECERLQGFPDGWTDILPNTPDSPRYKAIGNSMAVPVMRWIGNRIAIATK